MNGVNNCGNGPVRNLAVKAKPTTPSVISGATSVCAHATAVPYNVTSIAGINYAWTLPSGSSVASGQGTANITANWGTVSGNVKVIPSNACGNGPYRTKAVTVNGCPRLWNENDSTDETVLSVYPNPVNSMLTVEFKNELEEECLITITDMIGKNIYNATANTIEGTNKNLIDVSRYNKGLYLLSIKGKNINQSVMIAIQ